MVALIILGSQGKGVGQQKGKEDQIGTITNGR